MALNSKLFRGDPQLEACATQDSAHVTRGARGAHVAKIQQALNVLEKAGLTADGDYGPATAGAVLRYKEKRNIVNRSIQSRADDIVGKMTIASLETNGRCKPLARRAWRRSGKRSEHYKECSKPSFGKLFHSAGR